MKGNGVNIMIMALYLIQETSYHGCSTFKAKERYYSSG
jgi:hypothetical protein